MNRRRFLSLAVALPVTLGAFTAQSSQSHPDMYGNSEIDISSLINSWNESFELSPQDYLSNNGMLKRSARLDERSKKDFKENRTLSVNGLLLSQSEAAFLIFKQGI
jgi:hypothetical protein